MKKNWQSITQCFSCNILTLICKVYLSIKKSYNYLSSLIINFSAQTKVEANDFITPPKPLEGPFPWDNSK